MSLSPLKRSEAPLGEQHLPLPQTVPSTNTSSTEAQASLIALANIANLMEGSHVKMREALLEQAERIKELAAENAALREQLSQLSARTAPVSQNPLSPSESVAKLQNLIQHQTNTTEQKLEELRHSKGSITTSRSSLLSSDSTASLLGLTPEEKRAQRTQAAQECLKHLENAPEIWPFTFSLKVTAFITNNFDKSEQDIYNKYTTNLRKKWHAYTEITNPTDPNKQKAKRELLHEQKNVHSFLQTYASP